MLLAGKRPAVEAYYSKKITMMILAILVTFVFIQISQVDWQKIQF